MPHDVFSLQTLIDCESYEKDPWGKRDGSMTKLTDYVKTAEAAEILGIAQNTLRKWAEEGQIPVRRNPANGYRLFKRSDLEKFLKQLERADKPKS